jgi:ATP-dependent protease ClpP protease subunit
MEHNVILPKELKRLRWKVQEPVVINVIGTIDNESASDFIKQLSTAYTANQSVIPIFINSEGGCVYSTLSMLDCMKSCPSEIELVTICSGAVMSAAVLLFSAGKRRLVTESSVLMIHDVLIQGLAGSLGNIRSEAVEMQRINTIIFRQIAILCGYKDVDHFLKYKKTNVDHYLGPETALSQHLATAIIPYIPKLVTTVSLHTAMIIPPTSTTTTTPPKKCKLNS